MEVLYYLVLQAVICSLFVVSPWLLMPCGSLDVQMIQSATCKPAMPGDRPRRKLELHLRTSSTNRFKRQTKHTCKTSAASFACHLPALCTCWQYASKEYNTPSVPWWPPIKSMISNFMVSSASKTNLVLSLGVVQNRLGSNHCLRSASSLHAA
jgi:hypothetical protein